MRCLRSFDQYAVIACKEGDKNPYSSVLAENRNLLAKSSYGYQKWGIGRHAETESVDDETAHKVNNSYLAKKLNQLNDNSSEVESVKPDVEH